MKISDIGAETTADRLVSAVIAVAAREGVANCSARQVAALVGVAPSVVNYNFGSVERLLCEAFEACAARTAAWLEVKLDQARRLPQSPGAAAFFVETAILEWTSERRALALMYQEWHAAGAPAARGWSAAFADFWAAAAKALGLAAPAAGPLLHAFFESEALYHLSGWDKLLEGAALREMCTHFVGQWLSDGGAYSSGALALAEARSSAQPPWAAPESAATMARIAADIVGVQGLAALTHRAVAARSNLTLGAVTHHFPTAAALVAGAVRGQVLELTGSVVTRLPLAEVVVGLRAPEKLARAAETASGRRKLFLAAVRRPDLAAAGAAIRFAHGGTLRMLVDEWEQLPRDEISVHAGVSSRLMSAAGFLREVISPPRAQDLLEAVLDKLDRRCGQG